MQPDNKAGQIITIVLSSWFWEALWTLFWLERAGLFVNRPKQLRAFSSGRSRSQLERYFRTRGAWVAWVAWVLVLVLVLVLEYLGGLSGAEPEETIVGSEGVFKQPPSSHWDGRRTRAGHQLPPASSSFIHHHVHHYVHHHVHHQDNNCDQHHHHIYDQQDH